MDTQTTTAHRNESMRDDSNNTNTDHPKPPLELVCAQVALSLVACAAAGAAPSAVAAVCVLALGVPHGALDHVLHAQLAAGRAQVPQSHSDRKTCTSDCKCEDTSECDEARRARAVAFYATYFAIMGVWAAAWALMPSATLALFLAVSAYHFGEVSCGSCDCGCCMACNAFDLVSCSLVCPPT
jgi:hypothetical protein